MSQIWFKLQDGAEISRINDLGLFLSGHRDTDLFIYSFQSWAIKVFFSVLELLKCANIRLRGCNLWAVKIWASSTPQIPTRSLNLNEEDKIAAFMTKTEEKRRNFKRSSDTILIWGLRRPVHLKRSCSGITAGQEATFPNAAVRPRVLRRTCWSAGLDSSKTIDLSLETQLDQNCNTAADLRFEGVCLLWSGTNTHSVITTPALYHPARHSSYITTGVFLPCVCFACGHHLRSL